MLLVNSGFKVGDAITIVDDKMNEFVGRYVESNDETITLSSVRAVVPQANQGSIGISLHPVVFSIPDGHKATLKFKKHNTMMIEKSVSGIDDQLRLEETGIATRV